MASPDKAHGVLAGIRFRYDQAAPEEIGRPSYRHYTRPLFRPGSNVDGKPGAQNLREDRMPWHITAWDGGEGQVVLDNADDSSFKQFFLSEGLDARTSGQLTLNKSAARITPVDASGGTTATIQGNSYSDITGTSTVVNTTDRQLSEIDDVIESTSHTPGAGQVSVEFDLYKEPPQTETINGEDLIQVSGGGGPKADTTYYVIQPDGTAHTTAQNSLGQDPYTVTFTLSSQGGTIDPEGDIAAPMHARCIVMDMTGDDEIVASKNLDSVSGSVTLNFTPKNLHTYRFRVRNMGNSADPRVVVQTIVHGQSAQPSTVTLIARNHTDSTVAATTTVEVTAEATAVSGTLIYNATALKAYRYRVSWDDGIQRPILDKTITIVNTTTPYAFQAMELGQGGKVWAVGSRSGADPEAWTYDFTNEDWDIANTALADADSSSTCYALTHTDKYEYGLFSDGRVIQFDSSADADYTAAVSGAVGLTICQGRMLVLAETSSGVRVDTYAVDADVSGGVTALVETASVSGAVITSDTTLRQRIAATPAGGVFFVNYAYDCVIYRCDTSGEDTVITEIGRLDPGAKGSAITHVAGTTFISGQFIAETGETARSALWAVDQNDQVSRKIFFRRSDPSAAKVTSMQPYQNDLFCLQGKYIWRYSLQTGGLFLEYELGVTDETYARALAVLQGHTFAMFASESSTNTGGTVWVTGAGSAYRTSPGTFESSVYDWGLPGMSKALRSIQIVTDDMPANASVIVEYQVDQNDDWVALPAHTTGEESYYLLADGSDMPRFKTLQMKITLVSATGATTPTLLAVIITAMPDEFEEFFTLTIRVEDEDSSDHIENQTVSGGDLALALWQLKRAGNSTSFVDSYVRKGTTPDQEYLVRVEDIDHSNDDVGEGRLQVTLRVLA